MGRWRNGTVFNKRLDYQPHIAKTRQEQSRKIIKAVRQVHARGLSCMIFVENIAQCEYYSNLLKQNNLDELGKIQIFDDGCASNDCRISEQILLSNAACKGTSTLTTAAGGRAVDVENIQIGILTTQKLSRVLTQERGRIARSGLPGSTYPILCEEDFVEDKRKHRTEVIQTKRNPFSFFSLFRSGKKKQPQVTHFFEEGYSKTPSKFNCTQQHFSEKEEAFISLASEQNHQSSPSEGSAQHRLAT